MFDGKTKTKFHSRTGNTWLIPGIDVWSADRNVWIFFDSHGYERKQILIRNMFTASFQPLQNTFCWYTSTCHLGWTIHQGLKMNIYIYTQTVWFSDCERWTPIAELATTLSEERVVFGSSLGVVRKTYLHFENQLVLKMDPTFKTRVRSFCKNENKLCNAFLTMIFLLQVSSVS